jgi:hypothetical protein
MNSAPQIETVEISDAELDTVAGGLESSAFATVVRDANGHGYMLESPIVQEAGVGVVRFH